jgi:hypothetical protein
MTIMDMPTDDDISAQTGLTLLGETLRKFFMGEPLRSLRLRNGTSKC